MCRWRISVERNLMRGFIKICGERESQEVSGGGVYYKDWAW